MKNVNKSLFNNLVIILYNNRKHSLIMNVIINKNKQPIGLKRIHGSWNT